MTANQIAYWNLQETQRSNRAKEQENERTHMATEKETARSNKAKEALTGSLNAGQLARWEAQNRTDMANAVTGGIKNVSQALFGRNGVIGGISGLIPSGSSMGSIGF